jgi:hypothetical protein
LGVFGGDMSLFSKIFGSGAEQTELEAFLGGITPEKFQSTYKSVKDPDLRVPAAISVYVLYLAQRFASGLREMMGKADKNSVKGSSYPFDAIAFEAAAYSHFWLMREKLNVDKDENEDEPEEDDPYFECLEASAQLTSSLLVSKTNFSLSTDLLMNRSITYSFEETRKSIKPQEKFAQFLVSSFQSRSPAIRSTAGISSSLPLQLSVISYIPIFSSSLLAECKKGARVMYLAHQDDAL